MEQTRDLVALITGASSGIGLEIARGLSCSGITTIFTARNANKAQQAIENLQLDNVLFHELDITSTESVEAIAAWIQHKFGRLDILVNNAGICSEDPKSTIETNYGGAKKVTEAMIPLMKHGGTKIINISSVASRLDLLIEEKWKQKLLDLENLNEEVVEVFTEEYLTARSNTGKQWTLQMPHLDGYSISKMALSAYSRACAKKLNPLGISVSCMCPGLTNTGMTGYGHPVTVGADTAIWLATSTVSTVTNGHFYVNRESVSFLEIPFLVDGKMLPTSAEYLAIMYQLYHKMNNDC